MTITITTRKFIDENDLSKKREILNFKCLRIGDLPSEYIVNNKISCFKYLNKLEIRHNDENLKIEKDAFEYYYLNIGDVLPEDEFQKILRLIRIAGKRLMYINKKLKRKQLAEAKKQWNGIEKITI